MAEITSAFSELNIESNLAKFTFWKEDFLKKARKESGSYEQPSEGRYLQNALLNYARGISGLSKSPYRLSITVADANRKGNKMVLIDIAKEKWMVGNKVSSRGTHSVTSVDGKREDIVQVKNIPVFELETDCDGFLCNSLAMSVLLPRDSVTDSKDVWIKRDKNGHGCLWEKSKAVRSVQCARIIGALSHSSLLSGKSKEGFSSKKLLENELNVEKQSKLALPWYVIDQFRPFLRFLKPEIDTGDIVIALAGERVISFGKLFLSKSIV